MLTFSQFETVAQINLVPNPGFESYENCPTMFSQVTPVLIPPPDYYLNDWLSPNSATPDYYNSCSGPGVNGIGVSVPDNVAGHIPAFKGGAYTGIFLFATIDTLESSRTYREYVQVKLKEPLTKDEEYCLSFYTRPMRHNISDSSSYVCVSRDISLAVTQEQLVNTDFSLHSSNFEIEPQLTPDSVLNVIDWVNVATVYKAIGGEQWITIGNFKNDTIPTDRVVIEKSKMEPTLNDDTLHYSYYFIDEVAVFNIKGVRAFYLDNYTVCDQLLPLSFTARDNMDYYHWSNGETTQTAHFAEPGWYYIGGSWAGCPIRDSIFIKTAPSPTVDLGSDIDLCENGQFKTVTLSNVEPLDNYYWSNSSATPEITTNQPGVYTLFTEHLCGHLEDTIVLSGCETSVYIPNVFTPESRDVNSVFIPFGENIELELLEIYDHWGRLAYRETPISRGWDGYIKGRLAQSGVYVYHIRYKTLTANEVVDKIGDVTVIR